MKSPQLNNLQYKHYQNTKNSQNFKKYNRYLLKDTQYQQTNRSLINTLGLIHHRDCNLLDKLLPNMQAAMFTRTEKHNPLPLIN